MADVDLDDLLRNTVIRGYNSRYAPQFNPIIISYCNANAPCAFSNAFIQYRYHCFGFNLISVFANGFIALADGTLKGEISENLKRILQETKQSECLRAMLKKDAKNEAKVRNILAAHYFQPLAYGSHCTVDKGGPATCGNCSLEVDVGDTSMGSPKLWHGRADILVKNSSIKVALEEGDQDEDARGEPDGPQFASIVEVKLDKTYNEESATTQALAEGIVNAFCESKRNKSLFAKFIPSFLTTETSIRIILYNCSSDILFLSDKLDIWSPDDTLNHHTLVLVWLALHFDHFEMKLEEEIMKIIKVSNFQSLLEKEVLEKYKNDLSKPCPFYKPRITSVMTTPPEDDGTFNLATQSDSRCYLKILNAFERKKKNKFAPY